MRCSRNSFSLLRNSRSCDDIMATGAGTFVCGASGGALDADGCDDAGPSGIGADTDAAPFRSRHPRRHDCLLDLSRIADRTADEPALDLTVVGRRVCKPALECVPLVARQRVADHSEPRIAWRGCVISPIISNRRPSWTKRIFAPAAVTSARSISDLAPFWRKLDGKRADVQEDTDLVRQLAPGWHRSLPASSLRTAARAWSPGCWSLKIYGRPCSYRLSNRHDYRHFPGFRQRRTRRRTLASTFRETEEGSPLRGSSSATVTSRRRARAIARALFPGALVLRRSIIHATHAATGHGRHRCLLLGSLGDHRLCSDEQASNRGRIL